VAGSLGLGRQQRMLYRRSAQFRGGSPSGTNIYGKAAIRISQLAARNERAVTGDNGPLSLIPAAWSSGASDGTICLASRFVPADQLRHACRLTGGCARWLSAAEFTHSGRTTVINYRPGDSGIKEGIPHGARQCVALSRQP
jgi:hypothetical protein